MDSKENEDVNDNKINNEEEGKPAVMGGTSPSIEEHIMEHLPPTLHKGNIISLKEGVLHFVLRL